jgi:hypothetical protein
LTQGEQLALAPIPAGTVVTWHDARGRRAGRFLRVVPRGRQRGMAEVALGGRIGPERVVRVPLERLRLPPGRPSP